jgi:hypothetical protein
LNLNSSINIILKGKKLTSIESYIEDGESVLYKKHYNLIIEKLKKQEGFRAYYYDDKGYSCIGYGQRAAFYPEKIQEPITVKQAFIILEKSFNRHIKMVKRIYPNINGIKLLQLAKISYQSGIIKVIELMKTGKK